MFRESISNSHYIPQNYPIPDVYVYLLLKYLSFDVFLEGLFDSLLLGPLFLCRVLSTPHFTGVLYCVFKYTSSSTTRVTVSNSLSKTGQLSQTCRLGRSLRLCGLQIQRFSMVNFKKGYDQFSVPVFKCCENDGNEIFPFRQKIVVF